MGGRRAPWVNPARQFRDGRAFLEEFQTKLHKMWKTAKGDMEKACAVGAEGGDDNSPFQSALQSDRL